MPVVDKKKPRGTGEDILTQFKLPICNLILEYRGLSKLISTYIDALPNAVNPVDGRVHCQYNQIGAGTGRVSSDNPNMQNIPSNNRELRMLFKAAENYKDVAPIDDSYYDIDNVSEVMLEGGNWIRVKDVEIGDRLVGDGAIEIVTNIVENESQIRIFVEEIA